MSSAPFLVSKIDMYGKASPVAVCKSKDEADDMIDNLEAALPKGEISFFSRVSVVSADAPMESLGVKVADALACWAD